MRKTGTCTKLPYRRKREALRVIAYFRRMGQYRRVYRCEFCRYYHLTSQPPRN